MNNEDGLNELRFNPRSGAQVIFAPQVIDKMEDMKSGMEATE